MNVGERVIGEVYISLLKQDKYTLYIKVRLKSNRRRQKETDPGEAAEGSQLEESVTLTVQCHDEALRVAYVTIIYYGIKQPGPLQ